MCVCVCVLVCMLIYTHYDPNFSVHSFLFLKRPAVMIFDGDESALAHFRSSILVHSYMRCVSYLIEMIIMF